MEGITKWLIASPLGRLLAHRVVVALLAAMLGALGAAGLEFAPGLAKCLHDAQPLLLSVSGSS